MSKGIWVSGRFLGLGSSYWSQLPLWWKLTRHSSRVGDLNLLFLCDKAADKKNQRNSVGNQEVTCFQLQKEQYIYIYTILLKDATYIQMRVMLLLQTDKHMMIRVLDRVVSLSRQGHGSLWEAFKHIMCSAWAKCLSFNHAAWTRSDSVLVLCWYREWC